MKKPDLSIVILSYNTKDLLRQCLISLGKVRKEVNFVVIVPDNGSTDGSPEMVEKEFPWVKKVIRNGENLGFAAGNNVALKTVDTEYVLLLNPDTIVYKNTLKVVLRYLQKHKKVGAATCRVELPSGEIDYSCHRGFPTPWNAFCYFSGLSKLFPSYKLFSGYTATYMDLNKIHEIDSLTGAFAMIRTNVGKKIGWFDEDYFWNGEDIDFCFRLKKIGWKIIFIPDVNITHFKGSASGLHKTAASKPTKSVVQKAVLSSTQVMRLFYQKHLSQNYPFFVNWIVYFGINLLRILRLSKSFI